MSNNNPIGFIDSGVGGLTVVKEALKQLPHEQVLYLGDTARCPYGPRPVEQIKAYTWEMTRFLLNKNIKMLVIACNTATAVVLDEIRNELDIPVVGVIGPGSHAALKCTEKNIIGVIGTETTVNQKAYSQMIQHKSVETEVIELACPKFVPLVESQQANSSIAKKVVAETLRPLLKTGMDTLVLGCTHYPLLKKPIQNIVGSAVTLIDSGAETISEVSFVLDYFDITADKERNHPSHEFYTTGSEELFKSISEEWLTTDQIPVTHVVIDN
ncbi:glutamate racemase [Vagococcus coleopterorum]|uniref:Glutamate racemase n=1 Tax=Vagococcus coleopterorum TaxID=2714946 RepID=A0A6G8AP37_9ENTE|nr:glutamate racemase [Vagococcus coleopterorum]QIL46740.1 glutamate racemase [Vagococcus coleopterorum]